MRPSEPIIHALALLDGYRVRWTRETVARDIVQNFFDEVPEFSQVKIEIDDRNRRVHVSGPSVFELDYLRYIGATTKTPEKRKAGGFGEGFKICALVLLRDFGVEMRAGSGPWAIRPFLRPMSLGRELCYEVTTVDPPFPGSYVELGGVDADLRRAFGRAGELFFHAENPRLARPLHVDLEQGVGIYFASVPARGDLYYRRQHRGYLRYPRGSGLTFVFEDRVPAIDADRDRRNIRAAGPILAALAERLPDPVIARVILHLRRYWARGGSILTAFLREAERRKLKLEFPRRWLARGVYTRALEQHAARAGFHIGIERLGRIGMRTLEERYGDATAPRPPTPEEAARMRLASALYQALLGTSPRPRPVKVLEIGEISRLNDGQGRWAVVPARALRGGFREGISDCLYALAVHTGKEGLANGERLTRLLEKVIARPDLLQPYEALWGSAADPDTLATLPPLPDVGDDEARGRWPMVSIVVLAPPGFPPAVALMERLKRMGGEMRLDVLTHLRSVCSELEAIKHYARGIPSIWIGGEEIEAPLGAQPSYAPRTFSSGGLVPDDATLREVLSREGALSRTNRIGLRTGDRHRRGLRAYERYLRRHVPDAWIQWQRERALEAASDRLPDTDAELDLDRLAWDWARRALDAEPFDEATLAARALELLTAATRRTRRLAASLEQRFPELSRRGVPHDMAQLVLSWMRERTRLETPDDAVQAEGVSIVEPIAEVLTWREQAPLDEMCRNLCQAAAFNLLGRVIDAMPVADALAAARERFDAAVEHALERHGMVDEFGDPLECLELLTSLARLYPDVYPPRPEDADIAGAVRQAWEEAIAAGLPEPAAARRCLEAAEALAVPPWEREPASSH